MALPRATASALRVQQRLTLATIVAMRRTWRAMGNASDFDAAWRTVGPRAMLLMTAAQLRSASNGAQYVPAVLAETGQTDDPQAAVVPRRFAGIASDGRRLESLLYGAVTTAKQYVGNGLDVATALGHGEAFLARATWTQVADAYRGGAGVAIAARPAVQGYARALTPPSCSRCAILAGRWYRWNAGFDRHPQCDCSQIPVSERASGDYRTDPQQAYKRGDITDLTDAEKDALDHGADISRVVNARRGSGGLRGLSTTELSGRGRVRLTPEAIYTQAEDRQHAIELLTRFGYLR